MPKTSLKCRGRTRWRGEARGAGGGRRCLAGCLVFRVLLVREGRWGWLTYRLYGPISFIDNQSTPMGMRMRRVGRSTCIDMQITPPILDPTQWLWRWHHCKDHFLDFGASSMGRARAAGTSKCRDCYAVKQWKQMGSIALILVSFV